jgi:hypothetical protein
MCRYAWIMDEHCKHNNMQSAICLRKMGDGLSKDRVRIPEWLTIASKFVKDTSKSVLFLVGVWGNIHINQPINQSIHSCKQPYFLFVLYWWSKLVRIKQWWYTILSISIKRTTISHLKLSRTHMTLGILSPAIYLERYLTIF